MFGVRQLGSVWRGTGKKKKKMLSEKAKKKCGKDYKNRKLKQCPRKLFQTRGFFLCFFLLWALLCCLLRTLNTRRMVETNYTNVIKYMRRDFIFLTLELSLVHCMHTQNGWRRMKKRFEIMREIRYTRVEACSSSAIRGDDRRRREETWRG